MPRVPAILRIAFRVPWVLLALRWGVTVGRAQPLVPVGVAVVDITPRFPVHLVGYPKANGEVGRVLRPLHARALAMGDASPVVLITVELAGITDEVSTAVAHALQQAEGVARARLAISAVHTHTGPEIRGLLPYSFGHDLTPAETAHVARYTDWMTQRLIEVAEIALHDRRPARLAWGEGRVHFAKQRRRIENGRWVGFGELDDGPADPALPVLRITDAAGRVRAVFTSYACHATADGGLNAIHPDWPGEAAAGIEADYPGAVAMVALGCAGDAGPVPKGSVEAAKQDGAAVAAEVRRVLAGPLRSLGAVTTARYEQIALPLDRTVSRRELEERAASARRADAYEARKLLAELDAGRPARTAVPYPIQAWGFGDDLVMVFLGGEVVCDYSLRLRREFGPARLWVNAYTNDVACYVPSKRMYPEGGYEVDTSIGKYGWPTRLAIGTEDRIIAAVHALVPPSFAGASPN